MKDAEAERIMRQAVRATEARARIAGILRGDSGWTDEDVLMLDAMLALGRPGDVVANLPPVTVAESDNWGGRLSMPGESFAASALHTYHLAARKAGVPLPQPSQRKGQP